METARATQRFQRGFTAVMRCRSGCSTARPTRSCGALGHGAAGGAALGAVLHRAGLADPRSADEGTLDPDTAELMERSVEFGTRTAGEIMTPRVRTVSLEANDRAWPR